MSPWIATTDALPDPGRFVVARHRRGTWHAESDQKNVNTVVVRLCAGITEAERAALPDDDKRKREYRLGDVHGNNLVPYAFDEFGPDQFFGQDITHWFYVPDAPEGFDGIATIPPPVTAGMASPAHA